MDSVSQIATHLRYLFGERANQLAQETGCVRRQREFDGASLAQTMVFGWMHNQQASLERFTQVASYAGVCVTDTAIHKRFTEPCASFLRGLLEETTQRVVQADPVNVPLLRRFAGVVLEDSSQVSLPEDLAQVWRGSGDAVGGSNAAVKLHVRLELLSGQVQGPILTDGRVCDNKSPLQEQDLPQHSLYIADLGYFALARLQTLDRSHRYFLLRLKGKTALLNRRGHRLVLEGLLPQQEGAWVSYGVLLGADARIGVRLMIVKVPKEVAQQRREELQEEARRKGQPVSLDQMKLADWTILVTNVPASMLTVPEAVVLLRHRWQMERLFHRWKDGSHIDEWRSKKPWRILCELYAKLIGDVILHWVWVAGCWQDPERSLDKASHVVQAEGLSFIKALMGEHSLLGTLRSMTRVMQAGCQMTRRRQHPNSAQLALSGCEWPLVVDLEARRGSQLLLL